MSTHGVYRFACLHDSKRELGGLICVELQSRYIEIALFTETKIYKRTFAARRCNEGNTCLSEIKAFYSSQKFVLVRRSNPGPMLFQCGRSTNWVCSDTGSLQCEFIDNIKCMETEYCRSFFWDSTSWWTLQHWKKLCVQLTFQQVDLSSPSLELLPWRQVVISSTQTIFTDVFVASFHIPSPFCHFFVWIFLAHT